MSHADEAAEDARSAHECRDPFEAFMATVEKETKRLKEANEAYFEAKEKALNAKLQAMEQREKEILQREKQLVEERERWEEEKASLSKVVKESDVLELNVGGGIFTAKRSTLCMYDSLLGSLFSGRWEESGSRDSAGRVYLEFDRELFSLVLDWLRARVIDGSAKVPEPPEARKDMYKALVDYFQLDELRECTEIDLSSAIVLSTSCRGLALANPSAIFSKDGNKGLCGFEGEATPWIVIDLGVPRHLRRIHLTFSMNMSPASACVSRSDTVEAPWHAIGDKALETNGDSETELCLDLSVSVCRFLRLQFTVRPHLIVGLRSVKLFGW